MDIIDKPVKSGENPALAPAPPGAGYTDQHTQWFGRPQAASRTGPAAEAAHQPPAAAELAAGTDGPSARSSAAGLVMLLKIITR